LPKLETGPLALIRLDGDLYESTYVALAHLYSRLSPGGFVIVDDYGALPNCKAAVVDFRSKNAIDAPLHVIDWTGVWWQKP
jgi:O-methyltransferase